MSSRAEIRELSADTQTKVQTLLAQWADKVRIVSEVATAEKALRKEIINLCFPATDENPTPLAEGSGNKVNVGYGMIFQVTQPYTRKVDADTVYALQNDKYASEVIDKVFSFVPKLAIGDWKDLSDSDKLILHECVTEKPGSASAKLVRPKQGV